MTTSERIVRLVEQVQALPYQWPSPRSAASARAERRGSCASKHALLAEELAAEGIHSRPLLCIGPLVPAVLADRTDLTDDSDLPEIHELLTVDIPDVGPCRVDITWDPPLLEAGLPGTLHWDGTSDMTPAVGVAHDWYAPDPNRVADAKELLRRRRYHGDQRARRARTLASMSSTFETLRRGTLR